MKLNVELLQKIKAHILAEPRRFIMDSWYEEIPTSWASSPPCGTTACIAGWAVLLSPNLSDEMKDTLTMDKVEEIPVVAAELLGLPVTEGNWLKHPEIRSLFDDSRWPEDLYYRWVDIIDRADEGEYDDDPIGKATALAQLGAERIERFIQEYANER